MKNSIEKLKNWGWELIANESEQKIVRASELKTVEFVHEFEEYVTWDELLKRAKSSNSMYTQDQADLLLDESETIPIEYRQYNLIFPGTIWQSLTGNFHCPYLVWRDNKWCLDFYWFLYDFHHNDRLLAVQTQGLTES